MSKVLSTETFTRRWHKLPPRIQKIVTQKISLLQENPKHPSLKIHKVDSHRERIRVCYISKTMRLLYELKQGQLHLWDVGSHSIIDKVHLRHFSLNTQFHQFPLKF